MTAWRSARRTLVPCGARRALGAIALASGALLAPGCGSSIGLTRSDLSEAQRFVLLDSDPARRLLAELLARHAAESPSTVRPAALVTSALASDVVVERAPEPGPLPDQDWLRALGREVSVDFAALSFAKALGTDTRSAAAQAAFARFLGEGAERSAAALRDHATFPYSVLFAPAWLYRSKSETGADFADQRRLLDRHGIANRLIEADETASVNDGVALLADTVWPGGVSLVALGADHLLSLRREDAYLLALLRAVDFAVGDGRAPSHLAGRASD